MQENDSKRNPDDVRTEYTALSGYFNSAVTFRFTTLGFYLAAIGLIAGKSAGAAEMALLLGISLALWLLELRNRSLFYSLCERAIQIERELWGCKGPHAYDAFYSWMMRWPPDPQKDPEAEKAVPLTRTKILWWRIRLPISHTHAIDVLFLTVIVYSLSCLVGAALGEVTH